MAYSEKILANGLMERRYFGQDSSGIFKMYYNKKLVSFPNQKLKMGINNSIIVTIDMTKFKGLFHMKRAYIRFKISSSSLRYPIVVSKVNNLKSLYMKELGYMTKEYNGYYIFDITNTIINHLNTKLLLNIKTMTLTDLYTLFAFYDSKAELVIEYYDPNYLLLTNKSDEFYSNKKTKILINNDCKRYICETNLCMLNESTNLNLIINNLISKKFIFNFNQYIYGGINNYKYVDSKGITHLFKLKSNSFSDYVDCYDDKITLKTNRDLTFTINTAVEELKFNRLGLLTSIKKNDYVMYIEYDSKNSIILIRDTNNNTLQFKYRDNKIWIYNTKSKKIIKLVILDSKITISNGDKIIFLFDSKENLIGICDVKEKVFIEQDSLKRLKKLIKI